MWYNGDTKKERGRTKDMAKYTIYDLTTGEVMECTGRHARSRIKRVLQVHLQYCEYRVKTTFKHHECYITKA